MSLSKLYGRLKPLLSPQVFHKGASAQDIPAGQPRLPARTGRAGSDCSASTSCPGWCGLRSTSVSAPVQARRRSRGLWRTHRQCRLPATMALEMIGPMPGTVIRRWHAGSLCTKLAMSANKPSMRSSSRPPVARQLLDDAHHARPGRVTTFAAARWRRADRARRRGTNSCRYRSPSW
jgi:hypothetical protein